MSLLGRKKSKQLYYLLPSMGKANRRRYRQVFRWSLVLGVVVSCLVGLLIYILHKRY